jgi:SAM-dependent methyltransferase
LLTPSNHAAGKLLLGSVAALYFELVMIRYLGTEIRVFTNLKNIPLIACFFGLGLGIILGRPGKRLLSLFPVVGMVLFVTARYAHWLHLTNIDLLWTYDLSQNVATSVGVRALSTFRYLGLVLGLCALLVTFFVVLGGFVGEWLRAVPGLRGYGLNLAGSLGGALLFAAIAFLSFGPAVWLSIGFLLLAPFLKGKRTFALLLVTLALVAVPERNTIWSPYSRIDLVPLPPPPGSDRVAAYSIEANHLWHQWAADLSPAFLERFPQATPNRFVAPFANLVYRLAPTPRNVLVLGAGSGNDVAGALRRGAQHVDAIEIDPQILRLGKRFHPEHPYVSPRVTTYVTDARAFLRTSKQTYDLIVFAFLDSTTLLSGFSSIRLDNYVYTVESFRDARRLLAPDGTLILSFAATRSFAADRLYATLAKAFDTPPAAYFTDYGVKGVLLVEGAGRSTALSGANLTQAFPSTDGVLLATDDWPFLYLRNRSIPISILLVASLFLCGAWSLLRSLKLLENRAIVSSSHFFLLGAGFLLLETKAITQMSLLFGATWFVNLVVISSFLTMALVSNAVVARRNVPVSVSYVLLAACLLADLFLPYAHLNSLGLGWRIVVGGAWCALPVLLSGAIFSMAIKKVPNTSTALGVNLFGAVVGGVLENSVMIGGTRLLGLIALGLYAVSAIFFYRYQRADCV